MRNDEKALNVVEIVRLQESNDKDVRSCGIAKASEIPDFEIYENLLQLMELKRSENQEVRDLVSELLDKLSSSQLVGKVLFLIKFVSDKCFFVRYEAERLIYKIEPASLNCLFGYIIKLNEDSFDLRRISENLIAKIIPTLPLKEKERQYDYLYSLTSSSKKSLRDASVKAVLEVMQSWSTEDLKNHLPEFITWSNFDSCEISELAASLAFRVLTAGSLNERISNLEYMTGFNFCGNKEIRRQFRHLALDTMDYIDKTLYPKFSSFLLQNLEGKSKEDRMASWEFLQKISLNELPIQDLLYCQASTLHRMRRDSKKLANLIPEPVLAQNLELFIKMQNSIDVNVRELAISLALKISKDHLLEQKQVIEKFAESKQIYTKILVNQLSRAL